MRIDYHRTLVADQARNAAFYRALAALIRPGETVVADIGAGTGLIGLMAARLGAREVYLYETAEVAGVAAEILSRNRVRNCHLIPCHSTEMQDPPPVDVVVSETLGNYPFEEDIIETLNDARARFLKSGGAMVPSSLEQFVAPVVDGRIHRELSVWDEVGSHLGARAQVALDFSPAKSLTFNNVYVRAIAATDLLDVAPGTRGTGPASANLSANMRGKVWDTIDFTQRNRTTRHGEAQWKLAQPATVYGFATWWSASLAPGVALSTAPDAPHTHWEQLYFPLSRPLEARAGESITIALRSRSTRKAGTHLAWSATRLTTGGKQIERQVHDLDKGYLP
jgi:hypothetical protein